MTVKDMHYDFKKKLNKVDSQQYRNLRIPEIDWVLNEAQEIFIKRIAFPRQLNFLGFEKNQRNIDDIKMLLSTHTLLPNIGTDDDNLTDVFTLPSEYMFFVSAKNVMSKGKCKNIKGIVRIRQHDDTFEESSFDNSSFEWRSVNAVFDKHSLVLYNDGTFSNDKLILRYLKKPKYIHNAEDFTGGTYKLPGGELLVGTQDCILSAHTHREIVDIAVMITTGEIQNKEGFAFSQEKFTLNNN